MSNKTLKAKGWRYTAVWLPPDLAARLDQAAPANHAGGRGNGTAGQGRSGLLRRAIAAELDRMDAPAKPDRAIRRAELRRARVAERERPVCICIPEQGDRADCPRHGNPNEGAPDAVPSP